MGLLDALLGRTKPVRPNLDVLFRFPAGAQLVQDTVGFRPTGAGAVCYRSAEGRGGRTADTDIHDLLRLDPGTDVAESRDEFGYSWVTCRRADADMFTLMTQLHGVNMTLDDAGLGPLLLCTVVGFVSTELGVASAPAPDGSDLDAPDSGPVGRKLGLVYLYKRGTVYPFAPLSGERRDSELELRVRAELSGDLPIESDLSRWFPLWNAPVP
jgi:hypothetical protein